MMISVSNWDAKLVCRASLLNTVPFLNLFSPGRDSGTYLWTSTNFDCRMGKRKNKAKGSDAVEKEKSKSNFAGAPQVLLCLTVVAALIASWFAIGGNRGACTRSCSATGTTGASTGAPERGEQTRTQDTRAQVTGGESRSAEGGQARAHVNGGLEASKLEEKDEKEVTIDASAMETPKAEAKEERASTEAARQDAKRLRLAEKEAAASLRAQEQVAAKAAYEEAERQRLGEEKAVARQRAEEERERLKTQEQERERALRQRMLEAEEELKKKAAEYRAWYRERLVEEEKARRVDEEAELAAAKGAREEAERQRLAGPVGVAEDSEDTVRAFLPLLDKLAAAQVRERELDDAIVRAHTVTAVCLFIFCALTPWMQPTHAASVQSK